MLLHQAFLATPAGISYRINISVSTYHLCAFVIIGLPYCIWSYIILESFEIEIFHREIWV